MGKLKTLALFMFLFATSCKNRESTAALESTIGATPKWDMSDISFGFPLPDLKHRDELISLQQKAATGTVELLPPKVFALLGDDNSGLHFLFEAPGREKAYSFIRITSARIDPCFDALDMASAATCSRMIRLVGQVLSPKSGNWNSTSAEWSDVTDASIHLFYRLSDVEFATLLSNLQKLKTKENIPSTKELGIHPALKSRGLKSTFAVGLKELLLQYTNVKHLTRFTFMATGRNGTNWFWGMVEPDSNGKFVPRKIPPAETSLADLFTQESPSSPVSGSFAMPFFPEKFRSDKSIDAMTKEELNSGVELLSKNENPTILNSASVNCASCHVSNVTLRYALLRKSIKNVPANASWYENSLVQDLTKPVANKIDRMDMHAFSYRSADTFTVSPRAANETAAAVDFLNSTQFLNSLTTEARKILGN